MPHLNSRGEVAHGVGGGQASVDNVPFAKGGVIGWLDDDTVVFVDGDNGWRVSTYHVPTKKIDLLYDAGANVGYTGGGVVASFLSAGEPRGISSNTGFRAPDGGLIAGGIDGEIAYKPQHHSHGPTVVREPNGDEWVLSPGVPDDLSLLGHRRAIWREGNQVKVRGLPQPLFDDSGGLWAPQAFLVRGEWWIAYYSSERGIVAHPFDSFLGYSILPRGDGWFRTRSMGIGDWFRAAISSREGQQPGDIWRWDSVGMPRVDIRAINSGAVEPEPKLKPEPEPSMTKHLPQNVYETFRAAMAQLYREFPQGFPPSDVARRGTMRGAVGTVRAIHGPRWATKTEHNTGWASQSADAMVLVEDGEPLVEGERVKLYIWDMVGGDPPHPVVAPHESEKLREAYLLLPEAKDLLGGGQVIEPGQPETHRYVDGGNDSGDCDRCFVSRFDPVHAVLEGRVPHKYTPGEHDTGLCDLCNHGEAAPIHPAVIPEPKLLPHFRQGGDTRACTFPGCGRAFGDSIHLDQPVGGTPEDPRVVALLTTIDDKLAQAVLEAKESNVRLERLRTDVIQASKEMTDGLKSAIGGGLGGIFKR